MNLRESPAPRIGVLTRDFALYHDLVRLLRDRGIPFSSLAFGETPPAQVGVVLTSWRDSVQGGLPEALPAVVVPVDAAGSEDLEAGVQAALRVLEGSGRFHEVVVGVDPGKRPGVAVLGDGRVVHTAHALTVADVTGLVQRAIAQFDADGHRIRVGHGSPAERDRILERLRSLEATDVVVEVVDETGTTPPRGTTGGLPLDVAAAIHIARTRGRPAFARPDREPSERQVRNVQRESRTASGGRLSISRRLARKVALGEMTLQEAIRREDEELTRRSRRGTR